MTRRFLWLGFYDPAYSRNRVLLNGLRALGVEVVECRVDARGGGRLGKYLALWKSAAAFRKERFDAVVVAHPGLNAVWAAALLFPGRVVYDAFFSFYQSEIEDRGTTRKGSLRAAALFGAEWIALRLARVVLLDTRAHAAYFAKTFGLPSEKFLRVPIGADDGVFRPAEAPARAGGGFVVEFHGSFIPLQGVETILRAAARLSDEPGIAFRLIGAGQTHKAMRAMAERLALRNVAFLGPLPQSGASGADVVSELANADVALGIFGTGRKTAMVVPNKVYEGMACARPVVTAETQAVRELLVCGEQVMCVPPGDEVALADAIVRLRDDPALRERLSAEGRRAYVTAFSPEPIAQGLLADLARAGFFDGGEVG